MRKHKVKVKTEPKRKRHRVSAVRQAFRIAKMAFKIAIAVDTVRRVLADEQRREAILKFGRKAQSTFA